MNHALSPLEKSLWTAQTADPADVSTHLHRVVWLGVRIELKAAADRLDRVARHLPVLRRSFQATGSSAASRLQEPGTLARWVHTQATAGWTDDIVDKCVRQRFDLAAAPLVRVHILRSSDEPGTMLVFVAHHLLIDGNSFDLLTAELLRAIIAGEDDHAIAAQPRILEGIKWQSADPETWQQLLEPLPAHDASLRPYHRPTMTANDICTLRPLSADFMRAVNGARSAVGCSVATMLLSIYSAALHRILDIPELLLMTQIDVRTRAQRNAMGMGVNTVPVRSALLEQDSWADFLSRAHFGAVAALRHRHVPLDEVISVIKPERRADRSSIFTDFEFTTVRQWAPPEIVRLKGIPVKTFDRPDPGTRYGLSINVVLGAHSAQVKLAAKRAYYDMADLDMLQQAADLLAADLAKSTLHRPALADILPAAKLAEIKALGTGIRRPVTIQGWLTRLSSNCARSPSSLAVKHGDTSVSYRQLGRMIAGIARELTAAGIRPGDRIAAGLSRGPCHIAALLAILHIGATYVPVDPANPQSRIAEMLGITEPAMILTDDKCVARISQIACGPVLNVSREIGAWSADGTLALGSDTLTRKPTDAAYILFTSGSTGAPKGVEVGMHAFVNHLLMMEEALTLSESDIVGQTAPLAFDVHVWQCITAMMTGGTIVVYDEGVLRDPREFIYRAARDHVTVLELVPSYLSAIVIAHSFPGGQRALDELKLRYLISTGESLSGDLAGSLLAALPSMTLLNAYGPAEAADDVTLSPVRERLAAEAVPIGWPERNVEMLVVDRYCRIRPPGLIGQLAICGQVLANRYINGQDDRGFRDNPYEAGSRMYLTGDRCSLNPSDGFTYLGRSDDQVKLGGRRVELGEVDAALTSIPGVIMAAAAIRTLPGRSYLLAKVVTDASTSTDEIRRHAATLLPLYMVPAVIERTDELPLGRTGKIDRRRLASGPEPCLPAPDDELAAQVRAVWKSVLPPGSAVTSTFFASGGDSLRAMDLVIRLQAKGIPATISQVYEHQEFGAFVECLRLSPASGQFPGDGIAETLVTPRQEEMLGNMNAGAPVPVQAVIFTSPAPLGRIHDALNALVAGHPELRLRFYRDADGQHRMAVQPADDAAVYPHPAVLVSRPDRSNADLDDHLLSRAAGQLDVGQARHIALAALATGEACLAVSHLVCDIISLRTLVMELDEMLTSDAGSQLASSFLPWARQITQLRQAGPSQHDARYRSAVQHASAQGLARWLATSASRSSYAPSGAEAGSPVSGPISRIAERWPTVLPDDTLTLVAIGAVTLAVRNVIGVGPVRIDMDLDGRQAFDAVGVPGSGLGCFTLVAPVLLDPGDEAGEALTRHIRMALAGRGLGAAWDCSEPLGVRPERATSIVPLVNVVAASLQFGGLAALTSCRVPAGVPAHNAFSDSHAVTVDVALGDADDQVGQVVEFLVTPRPSGPPHFSGQFVSALEHTVGEALALATAGVPYPEAGTMPDGLELLGLSPAEIGELLSAVCEAKPAASGVATEPTLDDD